MPAKFNGDDNWCAGFEVCVRVCAVCVTERRSEAETKRVTQRVSGDDSWCAGFQVCICMCACERGREREAETQGHRDSDTQRETGDDSWCAGFQVCVLCV